MNTLVNTLADPCRGKDTAQAQRVEGRSIDMDGHGRFWYLGICGDGFFFGSVWILFGFRHIRAKPTVNGRSSEVDAVRNLIMPACLDSGLNLVIIAQRQRASAVRIGNRQLRTSSHCPLPLGAVVVGLY